MVSCFLSVVSPITKASITLAVGVLLRRLLLRQVPFAVGNNLAHVWDVLIVISFGVLLGVLLEDLNDFSPTVYMIVNPRAKPDKRVGYLTSRGLWTLQTHRLSTSQCLEMLRL